MNTGDAYVVERLDAAAHDLGGDTRLFSNRNIGRSGRNDQYLSLEPAFRIANRDNASGFVVHSAPIDPFDERRHLWCRPRGEKWAMMLQQGLCNITDLGRRLPFAQDHFGKSLSDGTMMIQRGKPQIFERQ